MNRGLIVSALLVCFIGAVTADSVCKTGPKCGAGCGCFCPNGACYWCESPQCTLVWDLDGCFCRSSTSSSSTSSSSTESSGAGSREPHSSNIGNKELGLWIGAALLGVALVSAITAGTVVAVRRCRRRNYQTVA